MLAWELTRVNCFADDVSSGMSAGLQGFLIFVCVSVVALSLLFVGTRYKTHIYLGFRDTCRANARDGKCYVKFCLFPSQPTVSEIS